MRKSWLLCVLLGTLAWGQAAPSSPLPAQPAPGVAAHPGGAPKAAPDTSASVPPTAAVITVEGVCPATPHATAAKGTATKTATTAKAKSATCKTVITRAEFERLLKGAVPTPNVTPQMKRQLANALPKIIAMSSEAKNRGLDKTPQFEEMMKIVRMQILSRELERSMQEESAKVSDADIKKYYDSNPEAFESFTLERLFVPRTKVESEPKPQTDKDEKLTEDQQKAKQAEEKAKQEEAEAEMSKLSDDLRARAAAGESFEALQKEAFAAAGMKIESPTVKLPNVRRTGLQAAHASVFELKAGDVSQVINDSGGHYIYKMDSKSELPVEQVQGEIKNTLQTQRYREMMEKLNTSFTPKLNPDYFGPEANMPPMPPRMGGPRRAPGAMSPQPQQTPPPANQPQAQPPAAKPN
jgi:PPIC-type PPIASE domain